MPHSDVIHIVRFRLWLWGSPPWCTCRTRLHSQGGEDSPEPPRLFEAVTTIAVTLRPRSSSHLKMEAFLQQQYSNFIITKLMITIKVMIIIHAIVSHDPLTIKYFKIENK